MYKLVQLINLFECLADYTSNALAIHIEPITVNLSEVVLQHCLKLDLRFNSDSSLDTHPDIKEAFKIKELGAVKSLDLIRVAHTFIIAAMVGFTTDIGLIRSPSEY
jgi:hypothetical protein